MDGGGVAGFAGADGGRGETGGDDAVGPGGTGGLVVLGHDLLQLGEDHLGVFVGQLQEPLDRADHGGGVAALVIGHRDLGVRRGKVFFKNTM